MKNYALLLLFALICCKSESKPSNDTDKTNEISSSENINNLNTENDAFILTQKTYTATQNNTKGSFNQSLSVSWLSEDTIQYVLTFESQSCKKTIIGGKATVLKPGKEPFMSSYKGASFEVKKYQERKPGFKIEFQIDAANKDKAVVKFSSSKDGGKSENCRPSNVVMVEQP